MRRKFLLFILFILSLALIWMKTPLSENYYFNKAKKTYSQKKYEQAATDFEKFLNIHPNNENARYYYVLSLSKLKPTYSIQKKMYEMANSSKNDKAEQLAKVEVFSMRKELLEGVEGNYIYNAISGNQVIRWNLKSFPLKIYYENSNNIPAYYIENIEKALSQWTNRTNFIKFAQADNKKDANIVISFKDYVGNCDKGGCHYAIAYTTPTIEKNNTLEKMDLIFHRTNPRKEYFSPLDVYTSALHEIGHTLGIMGHSDDSTDVMYSNNDKNNDIYAQYRSDSQYLSIKDVRTIALLYRLEPDITDLKEKSENYYYTPLILGSNEELFEKKLNEWLNYIQKYPNMASGYINLAGVYADIGDLEKSMQALNRAAQLSLSNDELSTVEYNKAVIYFNNHDLNSALAHAQKANSIKPSQQASDLIQEIKKLLIRP